MAKYRYKMEGRYGYWAIDMLRDHAVMKHITSFENKQRCAEVTNALNDALWYMRREVKEVISNNIILLKNIDNDVLTMADVKNELLSTNVFLERI